MVTKLLTDMSYNEFQALTDEYINRSSQQTGEMPASIFFELLFGELANLSLNTPPTSPASPPTPAAALGPLGCGRPGGCRR